MATFLDVLGKRTMAGAITISGRSRSQSVQGDMPPIKQQCSSYVRAITCLQNRDAWSTSAFRLETAGQTIMAPRPFKRSRLRCPGIGSHRAARSVGSRSLHRHLAELASCACGPTLIANVEIYWQVYICANPVEET